MVVVVEQEWAIHEMVEMMENLVASACPGTPSLCECLQRWDPSAAMHASLALYINQVPAV